MGDSFFPFILSCRHEVIYETIESNKVAYNYVEPTCNSFELFAKKELFEKHMQFLDIEVMRAHETTVSQRATAAKTSPHSHSYVNTGMKMKFLFT